MFRNITLSLILILTIFPLMNCSCDNKDKLEFLLKAEVYDVLFIHDNLIFTTHTGILSYNILTGKTEWENKETSGLETLLFNGKLITTSKDRESIYFLNTINGKIIKKIETEKCIYRIKIKNEENIFFIQGVGENYQLQCYDYTAEDIINLLTFDSYPRNLEYIDNKIFLITEIWEPFRYTRSGDGWLYVIDGSLYNILAKYPVRFGYNHFAYRQGYLFIFNDKEQLIKTDTNGNVIEYYQLPFDFTASHLFPDNEIILIRGDRGKSLYTFNH